MPLAIEIDGMRFGMPKTDHRTGTSEEQAKFCDLLADYLEDKPDEAHQQNIWAVPNKKAPCGTTACAMGWAAISGIFPGLNYTIKAIQGNTYDHVYLSAFPSRETLRHYNLSSPELACVLDGEVVDFDDAGTEVFGSCVTEHIFGNPDGTRLEVIEKLRFAARKLRTDGWFDGFDLDEHMVKWREENARVLNWKQKRRARS
jgi:hypothetical protein